MAKVNLTVSVAKSHLNQVSQVASDLSAMGFQVDQVMDAIGVITGSSESESEASAVKALSQVSGVAHIEQARNVQLPPPDSAVQ